MVFGAGVSGILVDGGLHRYFTHHAGKVRHRFWHYFLVVSCSLIGKGPITIWVTSHRMHHKFSDTEKDTHSPTQHGIIGCFFAHWFVWKAPPGSMTWMYGLLYKKDKLVKFFTDHYLKIIIVFSLLCYFIHPLLLVTYSWCVIMGLIGSGITNTYGHIDGKGDDSPRLNYIMCWMATPFHGTHHKQPNRLHYNEWFDPIGWVLTKIMV